jgi:Epoxide hydrolase N terminus
VVDEFPVSIANADVADLESRLEVATRPIGVTADGGFVVAEVDALVFYRLHTFDWRAQEAALNQLPHLRHLRRASPFRPCAKRPLVSTTSCEPSSKTDRHHDE